MRALEPPDSFHLEAATGWLELGNATEAQQELERMLPVNRAHPAALEVAWRIHAALLAWDAALDVARKQIELAPNHPSGWINQSYSLHELKRTEEAFQQLRPHAEAFPKLSVIQYNLACYACQLGDLDGAKQHLEQAFKLASKERILRMAMADRDLIPLREYLRTMSTAGAPE